MGREEKLSKAALEKVKDDVHGGFDYELSLELNLIRQSMGTH